MADWVKMHKELTRGAKRAIPRAHRFVFLEICLLARDGRGVVDLRADIPLVDALHAELGGGRKERAEIAKSIENLTLPTRDGAPMIRISEESGVRRLEIPSWERWNGPDSSADRAKKYREKAKVPSRTERDAPNARHALEERRVEEIRGEERESAPVATPPPPAAPMSANAKRVADQIASHRDLFAALTPAEVAPFVGRIDRELGKLERVDVWVDLESEVDSWVGYARGKSEERSQTPTQLLGLVENLARTRCRERPAKARIEREKRRDEQARATTWPDGKAKSPATLETFSLADEIAAADAKLAADRRKAAAEPKADPNSMRGLVGEALSRFKRRAV